MKFNVILILALVGCSNISPSFADKPTGEEMFDIIIKSADTPLKNEPSCDILSFTRKNIDVTLGQHLSTILSASYQNDNIVKLKSYCDPSKYELDNKIIDVWDCSIEVLERDQKEQFISSSIITFSIDKEKTKVLPGSIRCL